MANVKIEGIEKVQKNLSETEKTILKHMKSTIKTLANAGADVARDKVRGGLEMAHLSIKTRHVSDTEMHITTLMPGHRALSIEEGRRPGEKISVIQIARWYRGDRYLTPRRWDDLRWSEKQEILAVHSSIMSKSVKGKRYMQQAADAVRKIAPKEIKAAVRGIEQDITK